MNNTCRVAVTLSILLGFYLVAVLIALSWQFRYWPMQSRERVSCLMLVAILSITLGAIITGAVSTCH